MAQGAGIQTAQTIADAGVALLITGRVGPKAEVALELGRDQGGPVRPGQPWKQALADYREGGPAASPAAAPAGRTPAWVAAEDKAWAGGERPWNGRRWRRLPSGPAEPDAAWAAAVDAAWAAVAAEVAAAGAREADPMTKIAILRSDKNAKRWPT